MRPNRRTFVIVALAFAAGLLLLWTVRHLVWTGPLEIVAAEYGVPGRTCTAAADVNRRASEACGDPIRSRCMVSVGSAWCGDPAPGVVKTLTVDYMCGTTRKRASATDGTPLVLSCP
jgi:hypothetical protein